MNTKNINKILTLDNLYNSEELKPFIERYNKYTGIKPELFTIYENYFIPSDIVIKKLLVYLGISIQENKLCHNFMSVYYNIFDHEVLNDKNKKGKLLYYSLIDIDSKNNIILYNNEEFAFILRVSDLNYDVELINDFCKVNSINSETTTVLRPSIVNSGVTTGVPLYNNSSLADAFAHFVSNQNNGVISHS